MRPRFRRDLVSQSLWFDENAFGAPIYTPDLQIKALNNELIAYEKIQRYEFVLEFGIYVAPTYFNRKCVEIRGKPNWNPSAS